MPTSKIQVVTPQLADKWLGQNTRNYRKLKNNPVLKFAGILERGEWKLTPDCIAFDTEGRLMNGQHRLTAICVTGISAELGVMRGLEPEAEDVMDGGLARKIADALEHRGEHDVNRLGSALRWLYRLDLIEDLDGSEDTRETTGVSSIPPDRVPTTPMLLRYLDDNPDIRDSLKATRSIIQELRMKGGLVAACHYRMKLIDEQDCDLFWDKLESGADLRPRDPIYLLRKMMTANATAINRNKLPDFRQCAVILLAWNLWRDDQERDLLKWSWGGSRKDPFPLPK